MRWALGVRLAVVLALGLAGSSQAEPRAGTPSTPKRPPFDARGLRTGRFTYRLLHHGRDAGTSTISVTRVDPGTYRFRNQVTGQFRQTWEATATSSFEPLSTTLELGQSDDRSRSMSLVYKPGSVTGTATRGDPGKKRETQTVTAKLPADIVEQRIDWAAIVGAPMSPGQVIFFAVYDPWAGISRVSARVGAEEQVRVPAGTFEAYPVIYRIEKTQGSEGYRVWVSKQSPRFLVREQFPNGAVIELTGLSS